MFNIQKAQTRTNKPKSPKEGETFLRVVGPHNMSPEDSVGFSFELRNRINHSAFGRYKGHSCGPDQSGLDLVA